MKILLIAGHGAGDPGAIGRHGGVIYREAYETRTLAAMIAARLPGVATVFDTRRNAYADVKAGKLPASAFRGYDYVLEIYLNAYNTEARGTECYVTTAEETAAIEAKICQKVASLGFTNRGVKKKDFAVIALAKSAGVSSALLEVCFIDNSYDMGVYTHNLEKIAQAVAEALTEGFGLAGNSARQVVQEKAGLSDSTMDYLAAYRFGDELLKKLAAAMKE